MNQTCTFSLLLFLFYILQELWNSDNLLFIQVEKNCPNIGGKTVENVSIIFNSRTGEIILTKKHYFFSTVLYVSKLSNALLVISYIFQELHSLSF